MNRENVSAVEILVMLRERIFLSIDTDESEQRIEAFNDVYEQIHYLARCYQIDKASN